MMVRMAVRKLFPLKGYLGNVRLLCEEKVSADITTSRKVLTKNRSKDFVVGTVLSET